MTEEEINHIVNDNFRNIVCPYCNEVVPIMIRDVYIPNKFWELRENALPECREFAELLNGIVAQVRSGELSLKGLAQLLSQYRRKDGLAEN